LLRDLESDVSCACALFFGYSRSHEEIDQNWTSEVPHLSVESFHFSSQDATYRQCIASLSDCQTVTVVATVCHQAHKIGEALNHAGKGEHAGSGEEDAPVLYPAFDIVVLDESSQIPVARSLGALALLKPKSRLIVAGDHLQMPPIFKIEPPKNSEFLVGSIQTYLLKRNFNSATVASCDLLTNYRSHKCIVDYVKTLSYPARLQAHFPQTKLHLDTPIADPRFRWPHAVWSEAWHAVLNPDVPLLTLLHDDPISSQGNRSEADIVSSLVVCLRASVSLNLDNRTLDNGPQEDTLQGSDAERFWGKSIGIVTPHRAQRKLILDALGEFFPDEAALIGEAVDTVEKFQGGERHTILVSFGVGDPDIIAGEEAFLMQLERINVAISRAMAKCKCVVIMPTTLAGHVPEDKKAVQTAHALKGFVDEFCNHSKPIEVLFPKPRTVTGTLRWRG